MYAQSFSESSKVKMLSWFYLIFFLSSILGNLEAASNHHEKKHPSAVVIGTVYCDTCFQDDFSKASHFISGATVAVECKDGIAKQSFREEVKTDEHGEFRVDLPFSVSKHVKKIKRCSVKLINSSEPYCAVASTATSSSLHLKERKKGIHIFSAGFFTFKPLKQPNLCSQKPSLENSKTLNSEKTSLPPIDNPSVFPPPIQDPTMPEFPPIPQLPLPRLPALPQLPPLPSLPGLPYLPPTPGKNPEELSRETKLSEEKELRPQFFIPPLPPNPFLPPLIPLQPPSLFPPNPFQPPSPVLPPNPFQPPSPSLPPNPLQPPPLFPPNPLLPPPSLPFPPVPGLTPPTPPAFPIPLPPLPPGFPGIPPASSSSSAKKPSP